MFIACSCVSNYRKGNQFLKPVDLHGVEFIRILRSLFFLEYLKMKKQKWRPADSHQTISLMDKKMITLAITLIH